MIRTFLAYSCVHFPHHDPEAVDWLLEQVRRQKPDVVVSLGDMIDTACLGRWSNEAVNSLADEYSAVDAFCVAVNKAAPKAQKVWLQGNHEQRMFRAEHSSLSAILDYRKHIEGAKEWKHYPYIYHRDHCHRIGQVTFYHGFAISDVGRKEEAILLGQPTGLCISGHTHRPHGVEQVKFGRVQIPYWTANPGTFISPNPKYTHAMNTSQWGCGVIVGEANTKRTVSSTQEWSAELILYRKHWDATTCNGKGSAAHSAAKRSLRPSLSAT